MAEMDHFINFGNAEIHKSQIVAIQIVRRDNNILFRIPDVDNLAYTQAEHVNGCLKSLVHYQVVVTTHGGQKYYGSVRVTEGEAELERRRIKEMVNKYDKEKTS